ncbi:MAG: sialidase family protein [Promethearchaeota archaeon]|jgi:hypothetical protein
MKNTKSSFLTALVCLWITAILLPTGLMAESQIDPEIEQLITPPKQTVPEPTASVATAAVTKSALVSVNILVNDPSDLPGIGQSETSIAVSDQGIAIGWNDAKGFFEPVGVSGWGVSTDFGNNFTDGGGLPLDSIGSTRGDPALAVCPDGTFHYANLFEMTNGDSALSVHSGQVAGTTINWGPPVIAITDSNNFYDKEYLVCAPNGDLYMSYTNFVQGIGNGQIEFVRSIDGGATWSAPLVLQAQENVVNQGSYPAAGPLEANPLQDQMVCVAWQRGWLDGNPTDTIEVRCSANRGINFGPRVTAATFTSHAFQVPEGYNRDRVSDFPGIDIDRSEGPNSGTIYVAYQDDGGFLDVRDVMLVNSQDGGATWSAPVTLNDNANRWRSDEFWPWVSVCQDDGTVGVLWYSNQRGTTDVYLDISTDGSGGTDAKVTEVSTDWTATSSDITPNFGDYINLTCSQGVFHATWADGRNGDPDVFYAAIIRGWGTAYEILFDRPSDLELLRRYRDQFLANTKWGRLYTRLLYRSSEDALEVLVNDPDLMLRAKDLIQNNMDAVFAVSNGNIGVIDNTWEIVSFLDDFADASPPALRLLAKSVKRNILRSRRRGKTFLGFEPR